MQNLSPLYDVLSVAPYPEYQGEYLSLSLLESEVDGDFSNYFETYGYYTGHDFLQLGQNVGFPYAATTHLLNKVTNMVERHYQAFINKSSCSEEHKRLLQTTIEQRIRAMRIT